MIKVNIFFGFKLFVTVTILTIPITMQAVTSKHVAAIKLKTTYQPQSIIKADYVQSIICDTGVRDIIFRNDLRKLVKLDFFAQKPIQKSHEQAKLNELDLHYLEYFEQIPIIIKAENEYQVKNGDAITIKTKHAWELSIPKISNAALLSLNTIKGIVLDHFMPKRGNFMDEWVLKPLLSGYQKIVAPMLKMLTKKEASTTIIIVTEIEPHYEQINFSDIILDLEMLHQENKLNIKVDHDDEWAMRVTISPKMQGSLPNRFF